MDMSSNFRPEFHIAQQSRRDKLRIQSDAAPSHHPSAGVYVNNLDQIHAQGNLPYEYCSDVLNFPVNSQGILAERVSLMVHQESDKRVSDASFGNFCRTIPNSFSSPPATVSGDPQYFSTWKSIGSQSTTDWVAHQTPIFVGDGLSASSFKLINNATPMESHSPTDVSAEIPIPVSHRNPLQELVITSSNVQPFGLELGQRTSADESGNGPWIVGAYATDQLRLKSQADLISRTAEACPQWGGQELNYAAAGRNGDGDLRTGANDNSNTQALSLSLSSVPSPKVQTTEIAEKYSTTDSLNNLQDSRDWKQENLSGNISKVLGIHARHDLGTLACRNPGPLGPFTGYETILRSSKFLRPAQQLLDELCCFARPKNADTCVIADKVMEEVRVSSEAVCNAGPAVRVIGDSSGLPNTINDSSCKNAEPGAGGVTDSFQPENLQKKAKLLYMQDEVCKRYKQYHQQMQMVVSSFESVAGLSAATPYVSLALKMVSKHFRCLKNAMADQLKSLRNALGEDLLAPGAGTSGSKGDTGVSMLKFFDQSLEKQKRATSFGGILDGQHIWRPQRGLPERAVSILRAWLFDHFLHPYPTDTDKHMLASQTGLTRNQVSNWFINARVRLWKPMVEEIHSLESKGVAQNGLDTGKPTVEGCDQANTTTQSFNMLGASSAAPGQQLECSTIHPSEHKVDRACARTWTQEKRSRVDYHAPSSMGGSMSGLMPGIEMGGLGAVSLTLGLRQSAENAQRAPLQQDHHMRPHFGGQIIREFVG